MELIDKAKVVAEIEKRRKEAELNCGGYKSYNEHRCDDCTVDFYNEFLEIIDTLETKDIDFGCAVKRYIEQIDKQSEKKSTDNLTQQEAMDIAVAKCFNEQDAVDKVEPKFNVSDWICNDACVVHIASIKNGMYYFDEGDGLDIVFVDNNYHLWSIQDAKDGDVLLFEGYYNSIVLFQGIGINGKRRINYHCKCDLGNYSFGVQGDVACLGTIEKDAEHYHPATKEQRDLLFQKMHEAGYMWDSDSKQLLSLKAEPNNEKKVAWSEEDEEQVSIITNIVKAHCGKLIDCRSNLSWLESLKNRVIPQQEWSEEDEELFTKTLYFLDAGFNNFKVTEGIAECKSWVQSLKQRCTWKPSDKQIIALRWVLNNIPYNTHKEEISGLLEQLKKL